MKHSMRRLQTSKNLLLNILAYAVQFVISFYISPIIVSGVGASANGFITLANDFVSYAGIIASVFNAVAARFIAEAFYEKNYEKANRYFNSLIVTNLIISGVLCFSGMTIVYFLDRLLDIPAELVFDVKLTFAIIFLSYIVTLLTLVFTTSVFVANRTDLQGIRNIIQYTIRFACILILLNFVSIRIYWIALAQLIAVTVAAVMNVGLTKKLTPELHINFKDAKPKYVKILATSGIWFALINVSTMLLKGLDLTVANLMVGPEEMGLLSIAQTLPNNITYIVGTLAPIFTPVFLSLYTNKKMAELEDSLHQSVYTMSCILFVPICGFIVYAYDFFRLWQKSLSDDAIRVITILAITVAVQEIFNIATASIAQFSVVVNKMKAPVLANIIAGVVSLLVEFGMLFFTDLGIYAIVLSTTGIMSLKYITFDAAYAAYCLKVPYKTFYITTFKAWASVPLLLLIMVGIRLLLPVAGWGGLIIDIVICVAICYPLMFGIYKRDLFIKAIEKLKNRKKSA